MPDKRLISMTGCSCFPAGLPGYGRPAGGTTTTYVSGTPRGGTTLPGTYGSGVRGRLGASVPAVPWGEDLLVPAHPAYFMAKFL